jgi:hypothetical protein
MDEREKEKLYGFGRFKEYRDFIAWVVGGAALGFPNDDFEEQWTTDKAFAELRRGLPISFDRIKDKDGIAAAVALLEASHAAFRQGDVHTGAHLLWDFDGKLLELRRGRPVKTKKATDPPSSLP